MIIRPIWDTECLSPPIPPLIVEPLLNYYHRYYILRVVYSIYAITTDEETIATGRPALALAVGCTGKARCGVSDRLHWEGSIRR